MAEKWQTIAAFIGDEPDASAPDGWTASGGDGIWFPFGMATNGASETMVVWRRRLTKRAKRPRKEPGLPDWAPGPAKAGKVAPGALVAAVLSCLREITQRDHKPERCGTAARPVLSLWKAAGYPPLDEYTADVALVASAARESMNPLFARDVRGLGWEGATDRSLSVDTLTRHAKWEERKAAAERWKRRPVKRQRTAADLYPEQP